MTGPLTPAQILDVHRQAATGRGVCFACGRPVNLPDALVVLVRGTVALVECAACTSTRDVTIRPSATCVDVRSEARQIIVPATHLPKVSATSALRVTRR